jgi:hypothetical protein
MGLGLVLAMLVLGSNGMRGFIFEGCVGDVGYDL